MTQWHTDPDAVDLLNKAVAECAVTDEFSLDIEAKLEAIRESVLADLWITWCNPVIDRGREHDQDGFNEWHGQLTVEQAFAFALADNVVSLAA